MGVEIFRRYRDRHHKFMYNWGVNGMHINVPGCIINRGMVNDVCDRNTDDCTLFVLQTSNVCYQDRSCSKHFSQNR